MYVGQGGYPCLKAHIKEIKNVYHCGTRKSKKRI